jgi:transcriptional regulator with XRE-family HTH domain
MSPYLPIPTKRALRKIGQDISAARKRRRLTIAILAERAGISKATVSKIEKGSPSTSMGAYGAVLFALGMLDRLSDIADGRHDLTGRHLIDEQLPQRIRLPKG